MPISFGRTLDIPQQSRLWIVHRRKGCSYAIIGLPTSFNEKYDLYLHWSSFWPWNLLLLKSHNQQLGFLVLFGPERQNMHVYWSRCIIYMDYCPSRSLQVILDDSSNSGSSRIPCIDMASPVWFVLRQVRWLVLVKLFAHCMKLFDFAHLDLLLGSQISAPSKDLSTLHALIRLLPLQASFYGKWNH